MTIPALPICKSVFKEHACGSSFLDTSVSPAGCRPVTCCAPGAQYDGGCTGLKERVSLNQAESDVWSRPSQPLHLRMRKVPSREGKRKQLRREPETEPWAPPPPFWSRSPAHSGGAGDHQTLNPHEGGKSQRGIPEMTPGCWASPCGGWSHTWTAPTSR